MEGEEEGERGKEEQERDWGEEWRVLCWMRCW